MNVRDRIKAAEALSGSQQAGSSRAPKLKLETGEHIKEEVLRRGDGGWSKKVGIGTQQKFVPNVLPPLIKLTTETPVTTKPGRTLPGKLSKSIPGAFESDAGGSEPGWSRVERLEAEQQARMDAEAAERRETDQQRVERMEAEQQAEMDAQIATNASQKVKNDVPRPSARASNEKQPLRSEPTMRSSNRIDRISEDSESGDTSADPPLRSSRAAPNLMDDDDIGAFDDLPRAGDRAEPRERVLFDPVKAGEKIARRAERRETRRQERRERLVVEPDSRRRVREKSPSIRLVAVDDSDEQPQNTRNKHRSRSRSTTRYPDDERFPPGERRSGSLLWPSFSKSNRRSSGSIFETSLRPKSSHGRSQSDSYSMMGSTVSEVSVKKLEFAEYVAGKRLPYLPTSPSKPPSKPMGFVRSKSHTGDYREGFTRDKAMLRRPDDDEVIEIVDRDWERRPSYQERRSSRSKPKNEPWQLRLMQDIVRR